MTRNILHKLWPLALLAALVLTACGGSSSQPSSQATAGNAQAATATVSVQFPQTLAKALIDDRTSSIELNWYSLDGYYQNWLGTTTLTPTTPTATVEVPLGPVLFEAIAYRTDAVSQTQVMLARTSTAGQIVGGSTNINLRFLLGDWQFVDGTDNPLPLVLNGSSSTVTMRGFSLGSFDQAYPPMGVATRAAVDLSAPLGWADYTARWYRDDGAGNPVPFGIAGWGEHVSQFASDGVTTTSTSALDLDFVNLDNPQTRPVAGSRVAFIPAFPPDGAFTGSSGEDLLPALNAVVDGRDLDGSHLAGHILEMNIVELSETVAQSGVDCAPYWSQMGPAASPAAARARAVNDFIASGVAVKKAAPGDSSTVYAGTATANSTYCSTSLDVDGDGDFAYDYLMVDVNMNGLYDPADGDQFQDTNGDGNFDSVLYGDLVDGDGDGDLSVDSLTFDANFNGRLDPGDTFSDLDGDTVFDYTYYSGWVMAVTERYSNIVAREFRAKASYLGSTFVPVTATNPFIQYRTYEDSLNDHLQGWIQYQGAADLNSDIARVQLFDPSGAELFATPQPTFYATKYLNATWDGSQFGAATPAGYAGYSFNLSGYTSLPSGNYTFVTTLASGRSFNTIVNFPAQVAVPVVASASMNATWNPDGSLALTWSEPVGTFGTYRIVLTEAASGKEIFFGVANPGTTAVTLPATLVESILTNAGLPPGTPINWVMQTRNFTGTVNTSRGYSNPVPLQVPGPQIGTWYYIDLAANEYNLVTFLDNTTYLQGNDNNLDATGGPGIERGNYTVDTLAGTASFGAIYETNGDRGPSPNTFYFSITGAQLSITDPLDPIPMVFNRVPTDAVNPILGSWIFVSGTSTTTVAFFADGSYLLTQDDSSDITNRGFERGSYTWNSGTSAFTATGVSSSFAPNFGLAAPGATNTATVSISGNAMVFFDGTNTFMGARF